MPVDARDIDEASQQARFLRSAAGQTSTSSGGAIDVINDSNYKWTLNSSVDAKPYCPKINLRLLEMTTGQLEQLLSFGVGLITTDPYQGIYKLQSVINLTLPFFSSQHHSNSHTWEPLSLEGTVNNVAGSTGTSIGQAVGAIAGVAKMVRGLGAAFVAPAYKTELPHVWRDTTLETLSFSFPLYNIDLPAYTVHKEFVNKMINWTLPTKQALTFALPPVLCEYAIPGIRRGLLAKLEFSVTTKGVVANHDGVNIPEAYELTFSLSDLLMQTRNINPGDSVGSQGIGSAIAGSGATSVY